MRPVLIFVGDCGFCRRSVRRGRAITGDAVEYLAAQSDERRRRVPELDPTALAHTVHLVGIDGRVTRGPAAILGALATHPGYAWMLRAYERLPGLAPLLEWGYRRVVRNRGFVSWLTRPWLPE